MVEDSSSTRGLRMPQNLEAERALLGGLVLDNRQIDIVLDIFPHAAVAPRPARIEGRRGGPPAPQPEPLFFSPAHQTIFESIFALHDAGGGIDLTTLANHLHSRGQLEPIGGAAYLASLEDDIFSLGQVPEYARIIAQKWRLRCLIRAAASVVDEASNSSAPVHDIIESAERKIFEISAEQQAKDFIHVEVAVEEQIKEIESKAKGIGESPGLHSGFTKLDQMTAGFRPSQMVIIAARPSMGKTAFAMNMATNIAVQQKRPVGIFSLEMSVNELVQRIMCTLAHVSMSRVRGNFHLRRDELEALHEAGERLATAPLYIDDTSNLSILEMRSRCRRLKARCPSLSLIVIDYLQLMHGGAGRAESRQQEVSEISRSIKGLARELSIPIIALSQLSRQTEQRRGTKDEMPRLSDLRESGAIEQDADIVMFIHRRAMANPGEKKPGEPEEARIRIGKQRNGQIGDFSMLFIGDYTEFVNMANPSD